MADLTVRRKELQDRANALRAAGQAAEAVAVDLQIEAVEAKIAAVAGLPYEIDTTVDPSNRAVSIGHLTFELRPGTAPEPAQIKTLNPLTGPVAGTWDVHLQGKKVGWFSISVRRADGVFRVVETRTYDPSLRAPAQADFVAAAWVASFDAGESPLPPGGTG